MPSLRLPALLLSLALMAGACGSGQEPVLLDGNAGEVPEVPTLVVEVGEGADGESALTVPATVAPPTTAAPAKPPLVIYDTDMGPDVDDVLALAMLHSYQKRGLVELAAVTISRDSQLGAKYSDAVNTFFGRPDIPIGLYRGQTKPYDDNISFIKLADTWPNDVGDQAIPDGFRVQRAVLAQGVTENRPVILIQTGFSGNVSTLLNSQADDISPLDGLTLVDQAVSTLSIMAGSTNGVRIEFNVDNDLPSAKNLFARWPTDLDLSPFELGDAIHYPYSSIQNDFGWTEQHPVRMAYEFRDLSWHQDAPPFYNMKTWDLTSVMYAIEPEANYFVRSNPGTVVMADNGATNFQEGSGSHFVLRKAVDSDEHRQFIVNRMIELTSDQP